MYTARFTVWLLRALHRSTEWDGECTFFNGDLNIQGTSLQSVNLPLLVNVTGLVYIARSLLESVREDCDGAEQMCRSAIALSPQHVG